MANTQKGEKLTTSRAVEEFKHIFAGRTPDERYQIAHIKRFMERLVADPKFREKLKENADNPKVVAEEYGIDIDPDQMRSIWQREYLKYRKSDKAHQWPLAVAWDEHLARMIAHRDLIRDSGATDKVNPRFHAWRERQISRCASEVGDSAGAIVHPIVAYELSDGCSMGCWFCGISADKFKGYYPYTPENAELWRGVVQVMADMFGPAAQTGFCYWATDPADNPDYPKFIEDHFQLTGALPQTTTAAPQKNVAWTREMLAVQKKHPTIINRFSILSLKILDQVHAEFSAEDLLEVELVTQNRDALGKKANAGRAHDRREKMRASGREDKKLNVSDGHATIACVSGFLINMLKQKVELVTPTMASEQWPLGYRVYEEAHFDSAADLRCILEGMIDRHMSESFPANVPITFRDDLEFTRTDDGFAIEACGLRYNCQHYPFSGRVGEMILDKCHTAGDVIGELVADGEDLFLVGHLIQDLYDLGVLNDDPAAQGITKQGIPIRAV